MTHELKQLPPPYHLCEISRRLGTFLWFSHEREVAEVKLATTAEVQAFIERQYPDAVIMLSTMGTVIGSQWHGPNIVCLAVCDPMCSINGRRCRVDSLKSLAGARLRALGFVIGGMVTADTVIPDNHNVEDGCIPFELDLFDRIILNLPSRRN